METNFTQVSSHFGVIRAFNEQNSRGFYNFVLFFGHCVRRESVVKGEVPRQAEKARERALTPPSPLLFPWRGRNHIAPGHSIVYSKTSDFLEHGKVYGTVLFTIRSSVGWSISCLMV